MTVAEFAPYSWHDDVIHGWHIEVGQESDWHSEVIFDIDHIVEWMCSTDGRHQFRVAPATLAFHDAGDLCISIDCGDTAGQVALYDLTIDHISRVAIENQKICLDRPFYRWRIELNSPRGGFISFAGSGFTQSLRAEPRLSPIVRLSPTFRPPSKGQNRALG